MTLRGLLPLLDKLPTYREARDALVRESSPVRLSVPETLRTLVLAGLSAHVLETGRQASGNGDGAPECVQALVVTARPEDAQRLADELTTYLGPPDAADDEGEAPRVMLFPESEALPFERLDVDEGVAQGRLSVLATLSTDAARAGTSGAGMDGGAVPRDRHVGGGADPADGGLRDLRPGVRRSEGGPAGSDGRAAPKLARHWLHA